MKRLMLIGVAIMLGLFLGSRAQAGPVVNPGTYCTDEDVWENCNPEFFFTKFWKEEFFGGGPGQPGNSLMAIGQGFVFQNAVLQEVVSCTPCIYGECAIFSFRCETTYEGGMLTLNSGGPWLGKGSLKATNITAFNLSYHDADGNLLEFVLTMMGQFNKSGYGFLIVAGFVATPDNYEVKVDSDGVVFQVGNDFDAVIWIRE